MEGLNLTLARDSPWRWMMHLADNRGPRSEPLTHSKSKIPCFPLCNFTTDTQPQQYPDP